MNLVETFVENTHIQGHVQSFGYLLGLDVDTREIKFYSENITSIFPCDVPFFGSTLEDFPTVFAAIINSDIYHKIDFNTKKQSDVFLDKIKINGRDFHFTSYRLGNRIYFEFEQIIEKFLAKNYVSKKYENIHHATNPEEIWEELLNGIEESVDYERIMVYRFLEDGRGKVIAEKIRSGLESNLNLHYPANVFSPEIKDQYLKKRKRIFSNIYEKPVRILSADDENIDLSFSTCRIMNNAFVDNLRVNGVSASFSTSIVIDNELWGLVSCSNSVPKHIDLINRVRAEIFTIIASNAYMLMKSKDSLEANIELDRKNSALKKKFLQFDDLETSLFTNIEEIKNYPSADGVAIIIKDKIETNGLVPSQDEILEIAKWAKDNLPKNFYTNHQFNQENSPVLGNIPNAAGVIFGFPDERRNQLLMWFRNEYEETVRWANDPSKNGSSSSSKINLLDDKRKSGPVFIENIKGKSLPWRKRDILAAKKITSIILETSHNQSIRIAELNEELLELNQELDSFSYTISHDLGTPLTVMKLNAQLLKNSQKDNPQVQQKIKNILDEIDGMEMMMRSVLNLSRAKTADIIFENVNPTQLIQKVCYDVKLTLDSAQTEIDIRECPNVLADKTMLIQVFQNVIGNAVKYSSKTAQPKIEISGETVDDYVIYKIKDNGIGIAEEDHDKMFKIFNRMDNAKSFQGNGVGLSIVYRLMNRLGGFIDFKSKENEGTTFTIAFQKPDLLK